MKNNEIEQYVNILKNYKEKKDLVTQLSKDYVEEMDVILQNGKTEILFSEEVIDSFLEILTVPNNRFRYGCSVIAALVKLYGKKILPFIYKKFNTTTDEELKIQLILYIEFLEKDNAKDWYIEIIQNPKNNINLKCQAVKALKYNIKNSNILYDLYKNEKGKIKQTAFNMLAYLDMEDIVNPILERRYKNKTFSYAVPDVIYYGKGKFCTKKAEELIKSKNKDYAIFNIPGVNKEIFLLNKPYLKEFLLNNPLKSSEINSNYYIRNVYLLANLLLSDDDIYKQNIKELYEKQPEEYKMSYFLLKLEENIDLKENEIKKILKNKRSELRKFVSACCYVGIDKCYYFSPKYIKNNKVVPELLQFKQVTIKEDTFLEIFSYLNDIQENKIIVEQIFDYYEKIYKNTGIKSDACREINDLLFTWMNQLLKFENSKKLKTKITRCAN